MVLGNRWWVNERRVPLRLQIGLALAAQVYLWRRAHLLRAESMLAACVAQSRNYVASGRLLVVNLYYEVRIHHGSASIVVPFRDNGVITRRYGR